MIKNKFISYIERFRPNFLCIEIEKLIFPQCQTLLDVGCGDNSVVKFFNKKLKKTIGVDLFEKALSRSKQQKIHNSYKRIDALDIDQYFKKKSFDCVMAIDVIEHLKKNKAILLIKKMEKVAKKIVIIRSTNDYMKQEPVNKNPFQRHLSGFIAKDLEKMNYRLIGMDGPKFLRVNKKGICLKTNLPTSILANLLDPILRPFPKMSFNILAYKVLNE